MTKQHPRINELRDPQFIRVLLPTLAFLALSGVIAALKWQELSTARQLFGAIVLGAGCLGCAAALIRLLFCRVIIDENGVSANSLFAGYTTLRWTEIQTAAVYRLTQENGRLSDASILLTTRPPEDSLTREALTTGKVLARHEHLRIPLGYDRRKAIEHYLHMALPDFTL